VETRPGQEGLFEFAVHVDGGTLIETERAIFACPTGSHLFGTADTQSDIDLKALYLAPLERILLGRDASTRRASTSDETTENVAGDVDVELIEFRKFLRDALDGHPYAIEMLFCPEDLAGATSPLWDRLLADRDRLISSRLDPFVGYCRAQARKYGRKAERLETIERVLEVLDEAGPGSRIRTVVDGLPLDAEHVSLVEQPIRGQEEPAELLEVAGKRFELEARIEKALGSLRKLRDEYGERVRRAKEGFDWKAASHAYRVALELEELRATGRLEFPLEEADFLRRVKRGDISRERADREIPRLVERALDTPSALPDAPDEAYWEDWIVETYLAAVEST
jgi:hypothetical protein